MSLDDTAIQSASEYWRAAEERRFTSHGQLPARGQIPRSWTEYMTEARRALDPEIDAVALLVCTLRTRYNAVVHVNRLPSEILAHIFGFLQVICKPDSTDAAFYRLDFPLKLGWLVVTHVCRQWRSAALDHSHLWSNILFQFGRKWTEAFLDRSRTAPISFVLRLRNGSLFGADAIARHLFHIQELRLSGMLEMTKSASQSLRTPAPMLETIALQHEAFSGADSDRFMLPLDLFSGTAPRLRCFTAQGIKFAWQCLNFSGLVHLKVQRYSTESRTARGSFQEFLGALSRMPALETISLHVVLPSYPPDVAPGTLDTPIVALPNLLSLDLHEDIFLSAMFLKHIAVPSTTQHTITCFFHGDADRHELFALLPPWLMSKVDALSSMRTLEVRGFLEGFQVVCRDSWDANAAPGLELDTQADPLLKLVVYGFYELEHPEMLKTVCLALPLQHLELLAIHLDEEMGWDLNDWATMFGTCENTCFIDVRGTSADTLCEALALDLVASGHSKPLFPSLASLTLVEADCKNECFRRLPEWLSQRKRLAPLQKINIINCSIRKAMVDRIRNEVPDVFCLL